MLLIRARRAVFLLAILAFVALGYHVQAHPVEVSLSVSQLNTVWQSSSQAFGSMSRISGAGIRMLFGRFSLGMNVSIFDLRKLRIVPIPSFDLYAGVDLASFGEMSWSVAAGTAMIPTVNWYGWYVGSELTGDVTNHVRVFAGALAEKTGGMRRSIVGRLRPGSMVGIYFGFSLVLLFR